MTPYHLTHLPLPILHLKPHKEIVLHLRSPLSPYRYYPTHLSGSNLRHQAPSRAAAFDQSTTSGEPTRGRRPQPHTHINNYRLVTGALHAFYCSYFKSNTPTRASRLFNAFKLSKFQNGPQYLQNLSNHRAKGFPGPHLSIFPGLRDCELQNGHLPLTFTTFQGN